MSKPHVTVLMSVYNGDQYLQEAIESILAQTFVDFEFLIINDGSTDQSQKIIRSFCDSRIYVLENERNIGLTKSLNKGASFAEGRYIARMDADDISVPERLQKQVQKLDGNPDLVLLGSEVELITEKGLKLGLRKHQLSDKYIKRELLMGNGGALTHPVVMFRKTTFHEIGGYDERFVTAQDLDLFLKMSEVGEIENLSDILLHYRQHRFSINHTKYQTWSEMKQLAIGNAINRIGVKSYLRHLFDPDLQKITVHNNLSYADMAIGHSRHSDARMLIFEDIKNRGLRKDNLFRFFLNEFKRLNN